MAIVAVFEFPGETVEKYQEVFKVGGDPITDQPKRRSHAAFTTERGFTVIDVWEDAESFEAFGAIIGPAAGAAGLDPKPQVYECEGFMLADGIRNP